RNLLPPSSPARDRTLSPRRQQIPQRRLRSVFEEFAVSVERGSDLVLVKTVAGGASPVAEAIDDVRWPDVAGTVAGENTIIVVPRSRSAIRTVLRRLHDVLPR